MRGSTVFSGSGSAAIVQSVKVADGSENWRTKIGGMTFGAVTVAGDVVIGTDFGGNINAIDTATGRMLWSFPIEDRIFAGALVADNAVFAGADSGQFVALDTTTAAATVSARKRWVYALPKPTAGDFQWFANGIDRALLGTFAASGYAQLDDAALMTALNDQIAGRGSSVIVFADGNLPFAAVPAKGATSIIRRFIDAGGVAVFLGVNPLSIRYDEKGVIVRINEADGATALGLTALDRKTDYGYYISRNTPEGTRWGLSGDLLVNGALDPAQVTHVLARNQLGHATAWTKSYPGGGLVIYLPLPRNRFVNIAPFRAAIDHAIALR